MADFLRKNYFELFDLPVQFEVSPKTIRACYRKLQASAHPDKHAGGGAQERRLAMQFSALINEAYLTLKDPLKRGRYLLSLLSTTTAEHSHTVQDPELLMEQMSLREEFDDIKELRPLELSRLEAFIRKLESRQQNIMEDLSGRFKNIDAEENAEQAWQLLDKYQFFTKLHEEVSELV